ncbi:hypothetical protein HYH03_016654 [Edaphochlamys debaryana]|uniref:CCR4-NOT transcription complex subunit 10 n=1 Tax=Edaphochlamys debaryana TaxID=47281 RepID=A0A836BQ06_9CHLO|nr:hypothetical protein HYH03_016654 [Edaphochlamys debaryana]KAG2484513.1 hypothetical protein HYH03_016654 [Edaphochlamys debaryana]|eukprot:KAG2484512.1 hypothetical protein HYH03_016654 [Edaphochlamys debaryana]
MSDIACAEATCLWLSEDYSACGVTLQKLETESKPDIKLANNLLVVEHTVAGHAEAERICSQLEQLANEQLAADDGGCAADAVGSAASRARASGASEPPPLVPVRDDLAVVQLNRATLLYALHRAGPASALLEALAADAEALPEGAAVRALALALELAVEGRQLPRAVALLQRFERLYGSLTEAYAADRPSPSGRPDGAAAEEAGPGGARAGPGRPRLLALPRVSHWGSGAMVRSRELLDLQGRPPSVPDLKLLIKLYRSRLHALAHNTRAAKRELKAVIAAVSPSSSPSSAPLPQQPQQPPPHQGPPGSAASGSAVAGAAPGSRRASPAAGALLQSVRAQLELCRGRVRKATRLLLAMMQATRLLLAMMQDPACAPSHRPLLLNNLGLVHHQQGKHTLALLYLSQALATAQAGPGAGQEANPPAAPGLSGSAGPTGAPCSSSSSCVPVPAVLYNAGLQHLLLRNYGAARKCFAGAAQHYAGTPLLWLRTAEAALGLHRQTTSQQPPQQPPNGSTPPALTTTTSTLTSSFAAASTTASTSAASSAAAGELLSEAIAALATALQQLDEQQAAHEQWQSSSSKLEEGWSLSAPTPTPTAASAAAAASAGALGSGPSPSPSPGSGASSAPDAAAGDLFLPLPPAAPTPAGAAGPGSGGDATARAGGVHHANGGAAGGGAGTGAGEEAQRSRHSHSGGSGGALPNGVGEAHGTDASAALAQELTAVRRAVLANLAYAHLQAGDWGEALAAAQALLAAAQPPPPPAAAATDGGGAAADGAAAAAAAAEYGYLATSYAAEALCMLERPGDAVEVLSLWLMSAQESSDAAAAAASRAQQAPAALALAGPKPDADDSCGGGATGGGGGRDEEYPLGNAAALAALAGPAALASALTHLAAVFASQGEHGQAAALVRQALALQQPQAGGGAAGCAGAAGVGASGAGAGGAEGRGAALLAVYCELAGGNTGGALALLRQAQPAPA